jgi:hypothetical protein
MLLEAETNKHFPGGYDFGAISNLITWVLNFFLSVVIQLIWFGYIAGLPQWGGSGPFIFSNDYYLPSRHLEDGGLGVSPCDSVPYSL